MKKFLIVLFITLWATTSYSQKRKLNANPKESSVVYNMSHPLHDWDARAKEFKSIIAFNDQSNKIEAIAVVIPVKSFDSGNSNRDSHALEELEALKYPNVSFTCSDIVYKGNEITLKGKLNFHGVEKPLTLKCSQKVDTKQLQVTGNFNVNMTDYGVKPPGLMGMTTKEEIKLNFVFSFDL